MIRLKQRYIAVVSLHTSTRILFSSSTRLVRCPISNHLVDCIVINNDCNRTGIGEYLYSNIYLSGRNYYDQNFEAATLSFLRTLFSEIRGNRAASGSAGIYLHSLSENSLKTLDRPRNTLLYYIPYPTHTAY